MRITLPPTVGVVGLNDRLGRWVAAKRLRGDAGDRARQRFRREARTLAQLGHPGIVQIFDIVEDEAGDWIVMELVDGPTLAELRRGGPLDVGLALDYARQIASALEAAHASGIVHRDLKTENVMVLPSGHVKVLDFGLAHRVAAPETYVPDEGLTASVEVAFSQPGRIVGTPRAMSPEQAMGHGGDARSDLFSFGVLLYEILTARLPFLARTFDETLLRVIHHRPPPARKLNPRVSRQLSELVDRLLEKDPAHRPQTAAPVQAELVAIVAGNPSDSVTSQDLAQIETLDGSTITAREDATVTTLLASDLEGSTALFRRHDRLARDLQEEHGGQEIYKTDASSAALRREHSLVLFDRPWNAMSYALACHQGLRKLGLTARVSIRAVYAHRGVAHLGLEDAAAGSQGEAGGGAVVEQTAAVAEDQRYHLVFTGYRWMLSSGVRITRLCTIAWQMSIRSKGSL